MRVFFFGCGFIGIRLKKTKKKTMKIWRCRDVIFLVGFQWIGFFYALFKGALFSSVHFQLITWQANFPLCRWSDENSHFFIQLEVAIILNGMSALKKLCNQWKTWARREKEVKNVKILSRTSDFFSWVKCVINN